MSVAALVVTRLGVRHVERVVLVDEEPARPAELGPGVEERSVLVEDLDPVVGAVADEQPALRVHGQRVRPLQFLRSGPVTAPEPDEGAVGRELDNPGVGSPAVSVGDEDLAAGRHQDIGRLVEGVVPDPGDPGAAERHQYLTARAELQDLLPCVVRRIDAVARDPDIAVGVDVETVRNIEQAGAEAAQQPPRGVEMQNRVEVRVDTAVGAAPVEGPDGAIRCDVDPGSRAPSASIGNLGPVQHRDVAVRQVVGWQVSDLGARRAGGQDPNEGECTPPQPSRKHGVSIIAAVPWPRESLRTEAAACLAVPRSPC